MPEEEEGPLFGEWTLLLHELAHGAVAELEDEVKIVLVSNKFDVFDDVGILLVVQKVDFIDQTAFQRGVILQFHSWHYLKRHFLLGIHVRRLVHLRVLTFAQFFSQLVTLYYLDHLLISNASNFILLHASGVKV